MFHCIDILNLKKKEVNLQAFYAGTDIFFHTDTDLRRLLLLLHRVYFSLASRFPLLAMEIGRE